MDLEFVLYFLLGGLLMLLFVWGLGRLVSRIWRFILYGDGAPRKS